MKFFSLINFLTIFALSACAAKAQDLAMNGSPYTPIVTRNIFGLVPIPTNAPVDPASLTPPPKITANGIMTLFGKAEALYKISVPAKPGQPPKDQSYVLGEGESEDDIEVVKIDTQADVITFNNHGTIQELPLVAAPDLSTPSVPTPSGTPGFHPSASGSGGFPSPMPRPAGMTPRMRAYANQQGQQGNNSNPDPSSYGGGGVPSGGMNSTSQNADGLSPEAQVLLIEKQRAEWQSSPNASPNPGILPPTPLTDQNVPGGEAPGETPSGPGIPGQ